MSLVHLAAIVPVAMIGFTVLDMLSSWAKRRAAEDLELARSCCPKKHRAY